MKNYKEIFIIVFIQILLITLKLLKIINWKWVYILMPFWLLLSCLWLIIILAIIEYKYYDRND